MNGKWAQGALDSFTRQMKATEPAVNANEHEPMSADPRWPATPLSAELLLNRPLKTTFCF